MHFALVLFLVVLLVVLLVIVVVVIVVIVIARLLLTRTLLIQGRLDGNGTRLLRLLAELLAERLRLAQPLEHGVQKMAD